MANFYGSTETTGDVTFDIFRKSSDVSDGVHDGNVSIGKPVHNCNAYILDKDLSPVPMGESGEIYVSGGNISEGYMDQDKMSSFYKNGLLEDEEHAMMYRTGDYARLVTQ